MVKKDILARSPSSASLFDVETSIGIGNTRSILKSYCFGEILVVNLFITYIDAGKIQNLSVFGMSFNSCEVARTMYRFNSFNVFKQLSGGIFDYVLDEVQE